MKYEIMFSLLIKGEEEKAMMLAYHLGLFLPFFTHTFD